MWPITGSGEACGGSASHTRGLRATASKGGQYSGGADGRWPSAALVAAPGVVCRVLSKDVNHGRKLTPSPRGLGLRGPSRWRGLPRALGAEPLLGLPRKARRYPGAGPLIAATSAATKAMEASGRKINNATLFFPGSRIRTMSVHTTPGAATRAALGHRPSAPPEY